MPPLAVARFILGTMRAQRCTLLTKGQCTNTILGAGERQPAPARRRLSPAR
jgi:hypothetical protein